MCVIDTDDILCACADIGPRPLAGYQRWRGRVEGLDPPTHEHRRRQSTLASLRRSIENLLEGVTDDGWHYLEDDLIIACYHSPPKWIPLMKRIAVIAEYVRAAT